MNTMIVEIPDGRDISSIAATVRQLKGVAKVKVQKETTFERIPGVPYTQAERLISIAKSEEELRRGLGITAEQLEKEAASW